MSNVGNLCHISESLGIRIEKFCFLLQFDLVHSEQPTLDSNKSICRQGIRLQDQQSNSTSIQCFSIVHAKTHSTWTQQQSNLSSIPSTFPRCEQTQTHHSNTSSTPIKSTHFNLKKSNSMPSSFDFDTQPVEIDSLLISSRRIQLWLQVRAFDPKSNQSKLHSTIDNSNYSKLTAFDSNELQAIFDSISNIT